MASETVPRNRKNNRMKNDTETQGADAIASKDGLASIYGKRAYLAAVEIDRMVAEYFSDATTSTIKKDIAAIILRHFPHDAPVPEMVGKIPVVVYLATQADVDEFEEAFKQAKPNCEVRQLADAR